MRRNDRGEGHDCRCASITTTTRSPLARICIIGFAGQSRFGETRRFAGGADYLVERRPMDAALALYKAHFQTGFLFSYDLAELADYFLAYRRIVKHWKKTLPCPCSKTYPVWESVCR